MLHAAPPGARWASGARLHVALAGIFVAGVVARLWPLQRFALWGSDSGEYVFLTERLLDTGRTSFDYDGWGIAYPYFPGMFILDGAVAAVLGVDALAVQRLLVPVLAGLLPLLLYLIAREVVPDPRVALLSAAFLAVTSPHVLITSHAMPATLGHIFLLAAILSLVRTYREPAWAWGLPIFGGALLLTHHLTLYFLVGAVAAIALLRELVRGSPDARRLRVEAGFAAGLVLGAAVWWLGVATRFREEIVGDVLDVNPWLLAIGAILFLTVGPALAVLLRRRLLPPLRTRPRWPSLPFIVGTAGIFFVGLMALVASFLVVPVPGGAMRVERESVIYLPPVAAFVAFALAGGRVLRLAPLGAVVTGWLVAILASLAFAIATNSRVLFPFRHVDYFIEPLAIYAAAGLLAGVDAIVIARPGRAARRAVGAAVLLILAAGAAGALPPRGAIANFEEGMTEEEIAAVAWAGENLPADAIVAADHRLSSLLFGISHRRATFDYADRTYHGATLADAVSEMRSMSIPSNTSAKVTHVVLSPQIRAGVALEQFANAEPMSEAAQAKFEDARYFRPIYGDPRDRGAVTILSIEWPAIDADFP